MSFLNIKYETEVEFEEIARKLFDEYAIQTQTTLYRLVELEFYWNSPTHVDKSTYERKHVDPKSGEWFFHYSGVDIALKNEETKSYGGILIRSIYDVNSKTITKGPMVCAMKLFSCTDAFMQSIKTHIIQYRFAESSITKNPRKGLGQNAKENEAHKLNYSFTIDPKK